MSAGQIHIFVRDRDFGDRTLKNVLERIAWFADEDGRSVYPKMQTIADALGLALRTVQYQMRQLEKKGFIKLDREARQHRPRVYRLNVETILAKPLTGTARRRLELENAATDAQGEADILPGVQSTDSPDPQGCNPRTPGVQSTAPGVQSTDSAPDGIKKTPARLKTEESLEESEEEESPSTRARGTHLGDDWEAGPWDYAYGRERGFCDQEICDHASNFKTHFTAGNGRSRTHLRWSGHGHSAFAVWLRKERPGQPPGSTGGAGRSGPRGDRRGPASLVAAVDRVQD